MATAPGSPAGTEPDSGELAAATERERTEAAGRRRITRGVPYLSVVAGVLLWEALARSTESPIFVPLEDVLRAGWAGIREGRLAEHISASGLSFLLGYTAAVIVGVVVGVALGLSSILRTTLEPWLYAFYSIPVVALAPIFIIAFGIGQAGHVAVVFTFTVFAIVVNTIAGIGTAEEPYIEVARAYCGSRMQVVRYVLLPSAVPFILTGMRLGVTRGLIGVVVAELFGARAGMGYMILLAQQRFDTAEMYVGVAILAGTGILCTSALGRLERRLATWRPDRKL